MKSAKQVLKEHIKTKEAAKGVAVNCSVLALGKEMSEMERREAIIKFAAEILSQNKGELILMAVS